MSYFVTTIEISDIDQVKIFDRLSIKLIDYDRSVAK